MDAQDQTQMFTPLLHNVKHEPLEEHSIDVEDQLTLSQLLLFGKNLIDFPPKVYVSPFCACRCKLLYVIYVEFLHV